MVTIIPLLIVIGFPLAFVYKVISLKIKEKQEIEQRKIDLYAKAIENGVELPGDIFQKPETQRNNLPKSKEIPYKRYFILLIIGLLLFSAAIGIVIVSFINDRVSDLALSVGIVPLCLGIGFIASYYFLKYEQKKLNRGNGE